MNRLPAVAGSFYEADAVRLRAQIDALIPARASAPKRSFIAAVVPHAGLIYSGRVAGALYEQIEFPQTLIILCPNHTGLGADAAIQSSGSWSTPLGEMQIDEVVAAELMRRAPVLTEDRAAHAREHSLEVQLPFLQILAPDTRFVPICVGRPDFEYCRQIGLAVAETIEAATEAGQTIGILASTDLNHYESQVITMKKDQLVIEAMLARSAEALWRTVLEENISMCGFIPTATALIAAERLGAEHSSLVRHATSGDVNGDYNAVVGYASLLID